jgi:type IV fimbrial biogenesis protein FimT
MNTHQVPKGSVAGCRGARLLQRAARKSGFTLIEMLGVLAVTALLASMAAPSMTDAIDSVKLSAASNDLLSGLHLARSEAIKRNSPVVLCKSADGVSCASTGGWEQGWIVFHDANNNSLREPSETIILRELPLSASLRLTGNQHVARYVSFAPSGATKLVGGGFQAGTLTVCRQSQLGGEARLIVLNAVGRPRVQRSAVSSCV